MVERDDEPRSSVPLDRVARTESLSYASHALFDSQSPNERARRDVHNAFTPIRRTLARNAGKTGGPMWTAWSA